MATRRSKGPKSRLAKHTLSDVEIHKWFDRALNRSDPRPSDDALLKLAEFLKLLLHRADNAELIRNGEATPENLKDVVPGEVLQDKTDAILRAVQDYQDLAGDILATPEGDVELDELKVRLRVVLSIRHAPKPLIRRGQPAKPWKEAGRKFAGAVQEALKKAGYRGATSMGNPNSATAVIVTEAIKWAYEIRLSPTGFVTAIRGRRRGKPSNIRPAFLPGK